jgi:Resolvase, N terminal domain
MRFFGSCSRKIASHLAFARERENVAQEGFEAPVHRVFPAVPPVSLADSRPPPKAPRRASGGRWVTGRPWTFEKSGIFQCVQFHLFLQRGAPCPRESQTSSVGTRAQLEAALDYCREGDTLVVTKLDRLARSARHLSELVDKLEANGVALRILDFSGNAVDTRASHCWPMGLDRRAAARLLTTR